MKTITLGGRLLAVLLLAIVLIPGAQAVDLGSSLPTQQNVTEGRSVSLVAIGATGSVQWQVSSTGNGPWSDVVDDATHHGAKLPILDITGASAAMNETYYHFTNTDAGVGSASNSVRLRVAPLFFPSSAGIIVDGSGGLLVSDASTHTIRQVRNARDFGLGMAGACLNTVFAGVPNQAGDHDEDAPTSNFNQPNGIVRTTSFSTVGDVLVADTANATIRLLSVYTVTTLAGSSTARGSVDGQGSNARFGAPEGIIQAPNGFYYVTDSTNHTIRQVRGDGMVTTFAGSAGNAGSADGSGAAARFNDPTGIAVDSSGNLYVADTMNNVIRKITPAGAVSTFAGVAGVAGAQDGLGAQALFNGPTGLAISKSANHLYVADTGNSTIREITPDGNVTTYAGMPTISGLREGQPAFHGALTDGTAYYTIDAQFNHPTALTYDDVGHMLFVADTGNAAIRVVYIYYSDDFSTATLPLIAENVTPPQPPVSPPTQPPVTTPTSSGSSSSSGGGAFDGLSFGVLAGLTLLRFRRRFLANGFHSQAKTR